MINYTFKIGYINTIYQQNNKILDLFYEIIIFDDKTTRTSCYVHAHDSIPSIHLIANEFVKLTMKKTRTGLYQDSIFINHDNIEDEDFQKLFLSAKNKERRLDVDCLHSSILYDIFFENLPK